MNKIRNKIQKFFYNKYGADQFGLMVIIVALVFSLLATITRIGLLSLVSMILMIYEFYRMFSTNYVKRRIENDHYLQFVVIIKRNWKVIVMNVKDRSYHYYLCPNCHQMVRVPRGKGKIVITCPNCKKEFEKKS